jgi:N-acetyl-anhydromuramyl-L-alanine amidase AmpD
MISLAALAAFSAGCTRPAALPSAPLPRAAQIVPVQPSARIGSVPPAEHPFDQAKPAGWTANPWPAEAPPRDWTSIVIHHTATDRGDVASIHETHLAKKWLGIGYHFVIGNGNGMPDGAIEPTFRWREQIQGAHAGDEEYNEHGIGVCLIGNFEENPPTARQLAAVKRLVAVLKREYKVPADRVIGHSEVKATACPGRLFPLAEVAHSRFDLLLGQSPSGPKEQQVAARAANWRE